MKKVILSLCVVLSSTVFAVAGNPKPAVTAIQWIGDIGGMDRAYTVTFDRAPAPGQTDPVVTLLSKVSEAEGLCTSDVGLTVLDKVCRIQLKIAGNPPTVTLAKLSHTKVGNVVKYTTSFTGTPDDEHLLKVKRALVDLTQQHYGAKCVRTTCIKVEGKTVTFLIPLCKK